MSPSVVLVLFAAAWACVIAWLVRGRSSRWIKGLAVAILAALTAAFFVPEIDRAKHEAQRVELERRAQEQQVHALLREAHARR